MTGLFALESRVMYDAALVAAVVAASDASHGNDASHAAGAADAPHAADAAGAAAQEASTGPAAPAATAPAPAPTDTDAAAASSAPAAESLAAESLAAEALATPAGEHRAFIFVEDDVANYAQLASSLPSDAEVVVLDHTRDGLQQILSALEGQSDVASIHLVTHGSDGVIDLGAVSLNDTNISKYSATLNAIGSHLSADGDILVYGCDVAYDAQGASMLGKLSQLTGADVAASANATGSATDWALEWRTGTVESATLAVDAAHWQGELTGNVFDVAGRQLSFGANGQTITAVVGDGTHNGDKMLFRDVFVTDNGTHIDAVVTTTLTNGTVNAYDSTANPSNVKEYFQPTVNNTTDGGGASFKFDFYVGGSYNTGTQTGTTATLQNVVVNSYDIDSMGGSDHQYQEFKGFSAYELSTSAKVTPTTLSDGSVRFTNTDGVSSNTLTADGYRIQVFYDSITTFSLKTGIVDGTGKTAYFALDFQQHTWDGTFTHLDTPAPSLAVSGTTFTEAAANDGTISNTLTFTLSNATFTGSNGDSLGTVGNVPAGLTGTLVRTSATTATLTLSGTAAAHANANDISTLSVTFSDTAFSGFDNAAAVRNSSVSNLAVDFADPSIAITSISTDSAGSSAGDFVTNDNTLVYHGTTGIGSTVAVTLTDAGGTPVFSNVAASVDGSGNWTLDRSALAGLADGTYTLTATSNSGSTATQTVVIDTTAPTVGITSISTDSAGSSTSDFITNDTTLVYGGTTAGAATVTLTLTDSNGNPVFSNQPATITGGNWSLDRSALAGLADGSYTLTATATDVAGNTATTTQAVVVDTVVPAVDITSITNDTAGASASDFITSDNTLIYGGTTSVGATVKLTLNDAGGNPVFSNLSATVDGSGNWTLDRTAVAGLADGTYSLVATATDAAGNTATDTQAVVINTAVPALAIVSISTDSAGTSAADFITNDPTLVYHGTTSVGATVAVTLTDSNGNPVFSNVAATVDGAGNWTLDRTALAGLADGSYTLSVTATNAGGNTSTATQALVIDTTAPGAAIVSISDDSAGTSATDFVTNDPTLIYRGTTSVGATVAVTLTDAGGNPVFANVAATVDGAGNWTLDRTALAGLADGTYTISILTTDAAGNTATATHAVVIDTAGPGAPTVAALTTTNTTPTLSGTWDASAGNTLSVTIDGTTYTTANGLTASPDGTWTLSSNLAAGVHNVVARVSDAAGNSTVDASSSELTITVPAPPQPPAPPAPQPTFGPPAPPPALSNPLPAPPATPIGVFDPGPGLGDFRAPLAEVQLAIALQDQVMNAREGIESFSIPPGAFRHTDPSIPIQKEATLPDGSPLPGYVQFNDKTGQFQLDVGAAQASGQKTIDIKVIGRDPEGHEAAAVFKIYLVAPETAEEPGSRPPAAPAPGPDAQLPDSPERGQSADAGDGQPIDGPRATEQHLQQTGRNAIEAAAADLLADIMMLVA